MAAYPNYFVGLGKSGDYWRLRLLEQGWQITEMDRVLKDIPETLDAKLLPYRVNELQRAIYGASLPGINWAEVVEKKLIVLLDFRDFKGSDAAARKRQAITWAFQNILDFLEYRGLALSLSALLLMNSTILRPTRPQVRPCLPMNYNASSMC
ncbi:MAG: hypothetical protein IPO81_22990 [Kouleothrix sp.]|nr:hypothetical protein [Kouleothrix sp.]